MKKCEQGDKKINQVKSSFNLVINQIKRECDCLR